MIMALDEIQIGACIQHVQSEQINNLRFAEDIVLIAETPEELQALETESENPTVTMTSSNINIAATEVHVTSKERLILASTQTTNLFHTDRGMSVSLIL